MSGRTLRDIRRDAPEPDRRQPALTPAPTPHWATARDGTAYVYISMFPRTLDELQKQCREFGRAAVADVQWQCVLTWLMNCPHEADLSNPAPVAMTATQLVRDHERVRLGMPRHDGKAWNPPALESVSPAVRQEAELVAAETLEDWRKAGSPHMGRNHYRSSYLSLTSSPAFRSKYVLPMGYKQRLGSHYCRSYCGQ